MTAIEFNQSFELHTGFLQNYALTLTKDAENANDLFQETAYKAYKYQRMFRSGTNMRAWLTTIMKNTFINRYRRQGVRHAVMGGMAYTAGTPSPGVGHESPERGLLSDEISKALASVPEAWRQPFLMHHHGYRYHEIAEHLRIPIGTVKSKIHFARKALQHQLSELRYA